ncbi:hypothetical protein ACFL6P_08130 [Candidatus Latescibacterota bacterium]
MKPIYYGFTLCCMTFVLLSAVTVHAQENHSSLVYPGEDGKLVYVPDERGNVIPDYSYAGYMGGGNFA